MQYLPRNHIVGPKRNEPTIWPNRKMLRCCLVSYIDQKKRQVLLRASELVKHDSQKKASKVCLTVPCPFHLVKC